MKRRLHPHDWGLKINSGGELQVGNFSTIRLASQFGTPLHVINVSLLEESAWQFRQSVQKRYPGKASVYYAFKCNSIPFVVQTVQQAGLQAEVMNDFELFLAQHLGFTGNQIIVNGPCKTAEFLRTCLRLPVRFLIVDSLPELRVLIELAVSERRTLNVLLRVNPDYTPRGMNSGSATASRSSPFGLDLKSGEIQIALKILRQQAYLKFRGFHFHIGTGIHDPRDYARALNCLSELKVATRQQHFSIHVLDVGGGFASPTSREMTTRQMLLYQTLGKLPKPPQLKSGNDDFRPFIHAISNAVQRAFAGESLPELLFEPGRSITSRSQFLLLTVHYVKERPGVGKWLITDGGLGTVTLPTYYEYHEVFLCNEVFRSGQEKVTITGPGCFAGDVVYRNKLLPPVQQGEVLAIMDSGAYFTAMESNFDFPRPAVVAVNGNQCQLIRRRESLTDMINRDVISPFKNEDRRNLTVTPSNIGKINR